jgi:putative cardiolipin synthase
MHNKIVVADGHFAIVGGRNIGDRYFGLWEEFVQNDLDVMGAGPITAEVAAGFDDYWNSTESFPLDLLARPKARATELAEISAFIQAFYLEAAGKLQSFPLEATTWESLLKHLENTAAIGRARLVQDLPEVSQAQPTQLIEPLNAFLAQARERVLISSPYFLPDDEFVRLLERLEAAGVEVVILTNSLASNNHMIAHSGYEPWRKRLLQGGMELFESRDDSASLAFYSTPPIKPAFLGLHSKAIVVDGRYSYIGSANIDPRSLIYNTELAMFMDSETLAARLSALIERDMAPDAAWRVSLNERGRLRWTSSAGTVKRQPAMNFLTATPICLVWLN